MAISNWLSDDDPYRDDPSLAYENGPITGRLEGPGGGTGVAAPPIPTPAPTIYSSPILSSGGDGGGNGAPAFSPSGYAGLNFGPVPKFTAPVFEGKFEAPVFQRPSPEDVLNSPGFQFRVNQGQQGIERSAAARGLLRTGGTLKDIAQYNQNFASNEYNNEFNRALQTYQTQYQGKLDEFKAGLQGFGANYQGKKDEYAPLLAQWTTLANAELARALAAYNRDTVWYNPNAKSGGGGGSQPIILPPPAVPE